jgi:hypothetical protein
MAPVAPAMFIRVRGGKRLGKAWNYERADQASELGQMLDVGWASLYQGTCYRHIALAWYLLTATERSALSK